MVSFIFNKGPPVSYNNTTSFKREYFTRFIYFFKFIFQLILLLKARHTLTANQPVNSKIQETLFTLSPVLNQINELLIEEHSGPA